ncbi:MAG: tetratricopeptide repeat protein [Euryarchaeota archaeon]|nr:tetratricopeptide repeat protein [Euryarchaeota archaeon]
MPGFTEVENRIINKYISDPKLSRSLASIREVMEIIWAEEAPKIVRDFTDHGERHSERLAGFAEKILEVNPDAKFSEQEIYLLLAGIYLHDIGMQCDIVKYPEIKKKAESLGAEFHEDFTSQNTGGYSEKEQKEIRKNHHLLSAAWVDYLYEGKDPVLSHKIKSVPRNLVDDLIDVCKFHSKLSINDCSDYFNKYSKCRKKMVAALLRFADELDIDSTRVKIETVMIFSITPENMVYWWLHNYTNIDFIKSNSIRLTVDLHPEDFEIYGSFLRENYITRFKDKNQPVLNVLVGQKIPIVIDDSSDVLADTRVEKFPPEITAVLNEIMQKNAFSSDSKIPAISKNSDSETIQSLHSQPVQSLKDTISNIPYSRNRYFTGREEKLEQIRKALLADNTIAVSQSVAVCGLGGIGKTQTALEYTYRYRTEYEFIFWVKADSEDSIISDYVVIAKLLNLPVKNDSDLNNIVSAVLNWFRIHENWLLVIDNADDISFVKHYLPPDPKGHILLTSRLRVFDTLDIRLLDLEEMSPEEAKSFLLKRTEHTDPNQSELEALEKLVDELGYLPLALEQAGAFIRANNSSFKDYLVSYNKRGLKLLEKSTIDRSKYPDSISTTWLMNFEEVRKKSKVSADILFASAFLNPHEIPKEIFDKGAEELGPLISSEFNDVDMDPLVFDESLKPLWQYSIINRDAGSSTYDIHRLVQAVIRDGMEESEQKLWAERVVKAVNRAFPDVEYKNWELCDKLLPHAQICAEYIKLWKLETEESARLETEESARLLNEAGSYLHKRARFKESEELLKSSLDIREKILEPEHFDVSESLNNLGELYKDLGRYTEAEPLYLRSLEVRENTLKSDDTAIAESLNNLAGVYNSLGRYSDAESLYTRALEITEKALGPEHPDVGAGLNNLAGVYNSLGRYSDAESLSTRALKITEKALGPEHPDVGTCLQNLAFIYYEQRKYLKAKPYYERAIKVVEKTKGENSLELASLLERYASLLEKMRKNREATTKRNLAKRIRSNLEK